MTASLRSSHLGVLLIVLGTVGLAPFAAWSQPTARPDTTSPDTTTSPPSARASMTATLPPLTVTATRVPSTAADAPARVAVYDSTDLRATGATSVADLLGARANLSLRRYGDGGLTTASLRGTGASQTVVLLDGHRIADPQLGQLDLSLLPTILLESVEVMHGAASPLYGSDGIGGAIHLRTLQPRDPLHVRAASHVGAFGARGGSLLAGGRRGDVAVVTAAEYRRSAGNFPYTDDAAFPPRTVRRQNADRERLTLYAAGRTHRGRHALRVGTWLTDAERGLPGARAASDAQARQWDTQLRLWADDAVQTSWGALTVGGLVQHTRLRYADPTQGIDDTGRTWLTSLDVEARTPVADRWLVTSAVNGSYAAARHPNVSRDARQWHTGAVVSGVGRYGRLLLYPALRADVHHAVNSATHLSVNPRLGLTLQPFAAVPALHAKLHAGRAFRAPTFNDRYWQPGGTPDLRPEHGWSVDAGLRWDARRGVVEATGFGNWRRDQIVWAPTAGGTWSPENVSRVRALGVELSARRTWTLPASLRLVTGLAYTFTDARNRSTPGAPAYDAPLRYVPRESVKAHGTLHVGPVALDLNARYTGRRYITSDGSRYLAPYTLLHAQLRVSPRIGDVRTHASIGVDNLTDVDYRVVGNRPMPPRHVRVRVSVSL